LLIIATTHPEPSVVKPGIKELAAHPNGRHTGLHLKRGLTSRSSKDSLRRIARMRTEHRIAQT